MFDLNPMIFHYYGKKFLNCKQCILIRICDYYCLFVKKDIMKLKESVLIKFSNVS